jgi:hypothetical protein
MPFPREVKSVKQNTPPRREIPIWHILVGLSGWVFLLLLTNWGTLLLAVTLSALALPRFIRGSWDKADARITRELRPHP